MRYISLNNSLKKTYVLVIILFLSSLNITAASNTKDNEASNSDWYTHVDTDLGFTLQLPQKPNYEDEYPSFTIYSYNTDAKTFFSFFAIDLRKVNGKNDDQTIMDEFINNTISNINGKLLNKKKKKYKQGLRYEVLVSVNDQRQMRSFITLQNGIMYYLSVEDTKTQIKNKTIDTFFNSLKITKPKTIIKEAKPLISYTNTKGAFSLKIPGEPKDISREVANPLDEDGDPYKLNMYSVTDIDNEDVFLFRYNDQPLGYYVQDLPDSFEEMETVLTARSELVSEAKIIHLDGYEGREYELLLDSTYHSICRVYFRGNRTHLLLKQKLNTSEKVSRDHPFFTDFAFEPYEANETITLKPEDTDFEVAYFKDYRLEIDTTDYSNTYIKNSTDYYGRNSSTGGVYQLSFSDLQDYFKIANRDEFFDTYIDALKTWKDTIIGQKNIKVNGNDGIEFYIKNETTKVSVRHQIWLDMKKVFSMSAYLSKNEMNSSLSDSIFSSYKTTKQVEPFDYYASKTDLILKDLKASDTLIYKNAIGAFDYYEFDEVDVSKLQNALFDTYLDTLKTQIVKKRIVDELANINDSTTISALIKLYHQKTTNNSLKSSIITTIPHLKNTNRLEIYKELIFNSPPKSDEDYNWSILKPFRDSLDFAVVNYQKILELRDKEHFRDDVIGISTSLISEQPNHSQLVIRNYDTILEYALSDLKLYQDAKANSNPEDYNYEYNSLMFSYLNFINKVKHSSKISDVFTKAFIDDDSNNWLQLLATTSRIANDQPLEKYYIERSLDSLYSRFEIIEAFHKKNQLNKVPKKYINPENFAKLSLYNYIGEDDGLPDEIKTLGKIKKNNKTYYAFSFSYKESDGSSYFALVDATETISQDIEIKRYTSYTQWESPETNWKSQAQNMIPDLIEYGY
ncbi:hypothetical protein [Psychroserpens jangbogonensis]|uniref:hypothetical protein n=1 Tax=Psychroserpens jangbogonensis TaxID=1484460 RepID=UPI00053CFA7E|nr:hypothetical protein [Psychroserpens jangbogonensis]